MKCTPAQFRMLLAKGYTPSQIGGMNQHELEYEIEEARAQGITERTPIRALIAEPEYAPPNKDELISKIFELSRQLEEIKWRYRQYKIISILVVMWMIAGFYLYASH